MSNDLAADILLGFALLLVAQLIMMVPIALAARQKRINNLIVLSGLSIIHATVWYVWIKSQSNALSGLPLLIVDFAGSIAVVAYIKSILSFSMSRPDRLLKFVINIIYFRAIFSLVCIPLDFIFGREILWYKNVQFDAPEFLNFSEAAYSAPTPLYAFLLLLSLALLAIFLITYVLGRYGRPDKFFIYGMSLTLIVISYITFAVIAKPTIYFPLLQISFFVEIFRMSYFAMKESSFYMMVTEKELRSSLKRVSEKSQFETLGQKSAEFIHDIGNEMMVLGGNIMLVREKFIESGGENANPQLIEKAQCSVNRMSSLISAFKDMIGGKASGINEEKSVSVQSVFDEIQNMFNDLCGKRKIELFVTTDPQASKAQVKKGHIIRILSNLIRNSMEAIEGLDKKWISVEAQVVSQSLFIRVTDSGPGLSQEVAQKIMQPLYSTKKSQSGTGLGLSICQSLATELNGSLNINTEGDHAQFNLILPLTLEGAEGVSAGTSTLN